MANAIKALALSALSIFGVRTEAQPVYTIIDQVGRVEIRRYEQRFAAETTVRAESDSARRGLAFKILAGYIFGGNRTRQDIAMTAPVQTEGAKKIEMTAPVQTEAPEDGALTMRFFLPPDVTPTNAPIPNDTRVNLVEVPAETVAVFRYTGSWSAEIIAAREAELLAALAKSEWKISGEPFSLFYDPPFTLPPLRRNEAAIRVSK